MSFLGFNVEGGFLEGIVRGFKSSLLTTANYSNLGQCETLEDFKLQLAATDYGNFLQQETMITPSVITEKARERLIADFKYLRANANHPVAGFLDYLT
ncbi:H(+)-transporting V0 sector ATPase subunit d [Kappamyces sp. JEL0680]|nr:H(+)-transporting V0 sector ATPase subunit d [Kappamyces sp. JEL0680]